MSDFLTRLTEEDAPEAREVSYNGETGTVWFRKLSAGQREELLKGTVVRHVPGSGGSIDIDLGQNEHQRQVLVLYSVCDEKGKRHFKDLPAVRRLAHDRLAALAVHAEAVNRIAEDEDPGKA